MQHEDLRRQRPVGDQAGKVALHCVHVGGAEAADRGARPRALSGGGEFRVERQVHERLGEGVLEPLHLVQGVGPPHLHVEEEQQAPLARELHVGREQVVRDAREVAPVAPRSGLRDGDDQVQRRHHPAFAVECVVFGGDTHDFVRDALGRVDAQRTHDGDARVAVEGDDLRAFEQRWLCGNALVGYGDDALGVVLVGGPVARALVRACAGDRDWERRGVRRRQRDGHSGRGGRSGGGALRPGESSGGEQEEGEQAAARQTVQEGCSVRCPAVPGSLSHR